MNQPTRRPDRFSKSLLAIDTYPNGKTCPIKYDVENLSGLPTAMRAMRPDRFSKSPARERFLATTARSIENSGENLLGLPTAMRAMRPDRFSKSPARERFLATTARSNENSMENLSGLETAVGQ